MNESIEYLEKCLVDIHSDEIQLQTLLKLVDGLKLTDPHRALEYSCKAYKLSERVDPTVNRPIASYQLAYAYLRLGEVQKALDAFREAVAGHRENNNLLEELSALIGEGRALYGLYRHIEALEIFTNVRQTADRLKSDVHYREALNQIGLCLRQLHRYDEALTCLEECLERSQQAEDNFAIASASKVMGDIKRDQGKHVEALDHLFVARDLYVDLDSKTSLSTIHNHIAITWAELGNYPAAFDSYSEALRISEELRYREGCASILNNMGRLYLYIEDPKNAVEYLTESLRLKEEIGIPPMMMSTLRNLAEANIQQGAVEQARVLLERCGAILEDDPNDVEDAYLKGIWCEYHTACGEHQSALTGYEECAAVFERVGNQAALIESLRLAGESLMQLGNLDEAITRFKEALAHTETVEQEQIQGKLHTSISAAYKQKGDAESALAHQEIAHQLQQKFFDEKTRDKLFQLMTLYDLDRARKARQIAEQQAEILQLEKEQIEERAEHQQKELTTTAMFLTQKNDFLRKIRSRLGRVADLLDGQGAAMVREIQQEINSTIDVKESWGIFEAQFRHVHGEFLEHLAARHPELSPTELRVSALVKIGLSIKESAQIMNAEPRSIETYRGRIRKKVGLKREENLATYLAALH